MLSPDILKHLCRLHFTEPQFFKIKFMKLPWNKTTKQRIDFICQQQKQTNQMI